MAVVASPGIRVRRGLSRLAPAISMANAGRVAARAALLSRGLAPILRRSAARARRPTLTVGGLGCVTIAAFTIAAALGWLVAGVGLLWLEALTTPDGED